jgi:hypothetical protein
MRGLQTDQTAQVVIAGHAFVQNLRRGNYELGASAPATGCDSPQRSPNCLKRSDVTFGRLRLPALLATQQRPRRC